MAVDVIRLEKGGLTVDVSPLGGFILSANWHAMPFLKPAASPGLASQVFGAETCFPLVPFGNRIENNRFHFEGQDHALRPNTADPLVLHGDGWLKRWEILKQAPDGIVFRYVHDLNNGSPFAYEAIQTIDICDDSLSLSLTITNKASRRLPYGLGFHPYFPRTQATRLFANVKRQWSERENHLPGEAGPLPTDLDFPNGRPLPGRWLNNAFDGWGGKARIELPETGLALSLEADAIFGHFVLYFPSEDSGFFCLEPMSHLPNAHSVKHFAGLVALEPGQQLSGRMTLRLAKLAHSH